MDPIVSEAPSQTIDVPAAEALMAVLGLDGLLAEKFRRPTVEQFTRAGRLPRDIQRLLRRFIDATTFDKREKEDAKPIDYDDVLERLADAVTPDRLARIQAAFGEQVDLGIDYGARVMAVMQYLRSRLPIVARQGLITSKRGRPSDSEIAEFARVYAIAEDPLIVLRHLLAGVLTSDEVTALGVLYPGIADAIALQFGREVAAKLTRSPSWELDGPRERMAEILLGTTTIDLDLAAWIQQALKPKEQEQGGAPPTPNSKSSDRWMSAGQKLLAG